MGVISKRKIEQVEAVLDGDAIDRSGNFFERIRLVHRALPELDLEDVDPSVTLLGKRLSFPLIISAMTGGDHELLLRINRNLAQAAERCGVAMAVGSQRVLFSSPEARPSFALRPFAPNVLMIGNLGAVQLNKGFDLEHCREAVRVLEADALNLHLNPLQEAVQEEGDTCFSRLAERMGNVASKLEVPLVVKEVGAGISLPDARLLLENGIRHIDVAGSGGTSWSRVESLRARGVRSRQLGLLFQDWGLPTPLALRMLLPLRDELTLFASGGIRHGIDMVKAMILGASACGIARPFLKPATVSADAVVAEIAFLRRTFVTAMFLLGQRNISYLKGNLSLILSDEHPLNTPGTSSESGGNREPGEGLR